LQTSPLKEAIEILGEELTLSLQRRLMQLRALVHPMDKKHGSVVITAFIADFIQRYDVNFEDYCLVEQRLIAELGFLDWDLNVHKRGKRYFVKGKVYKLEEGEPTQ
jgi:hypothetical protein